MEALLGLRVALVFSVVAHFSLLAKSSSFSSQEFQIVNVESRNWKYTHNILYLKAGRPLLSLDTDYHCKASFLSDLMVGLTSTSAFGCPLVETVVDKLTTKGNFMSTDQYPFQDTKSRFQVQVISYLQGLSLEGIGVEDSV